MPRPLAAAVKSLPASVAGGKPSAAAGGAGPALPLFAPAITTTATPKTTMARIGIATRIPQPRNSSPAMNSRDQRRLTGSGTKERTSLAHSAPAAFRSGRAGRPRRFRPGAVRAGGRSRVRPARAGAGGPGPGIGPKGAGRAAELTAGWHRVGAGR